MNTVSLLDRGQAFSRKKVAQQRTLEINKKIIFVETFEDIFQKIFGDD